MPRKIYRRVRTPVVSGVARYGRRQYRRKAQRGSTLRLRYSGGKLAAVHSMYHFPRLVARTEMLMRGRSHWGLWPDVRRRG